MEQHELADVLKGSFPELSQTEFEKMISICEFKKYPSKAIIIKSGTLSKKAFLIVKGSVRGYIYDESGNEKNILLRSKGIFVADAEAIFSDEPQKLNLETMDKTSGLLFSMEQFEKLANEHKGIQQLYINSLKEAILRLTYRVGSLITMTSEQRYLDLLDKNPSFLRDAFDKYVANYLGITPVSFSRIKKKINQSEVNK